MQRDSQLRLPLLILSLVCLLPGSSASADELDAVGGLFFRLPFAADGSGPEKPRIGLGVGPTALPRAGFSFEMDARGMARMGLVGYRWHWQVPPLEAWGSDLQSSEGGFETDPLGSPTTASE